MGIIGIDHVQLAMPRGREADAEVFYAGVLGLTRVPKPPHLEARGGCWFELGEVRIHLGVDPDFRSAARAHPALLVDDLAMFVRELGSRGIATTPGRPLEGCLRCDIEDPFGNRIELMQRIES